MQSKVLGLSYADREAARADGRRPLFSGCTAQAIFFRRRHQPRRPPLAKIRPGLGRPDYGEPKAKAC